MIETYVVCEPLGSSRTRSHEVDHTKREDKDEVTPNPTRRPRLTRRQRSVPGERVRNVPDGVRKEQKRR